MADASAPGAGLSSMEENARYLSNDEKSSRRKASYAQRDSSRINLLENFKRWRDLREKLGMSKDKELAKFLMDFYESAQEKNCSSVNNSPRAAKTSVTPSPATPSLDHPIFAPQGTGRAEPIPLAIKADRGGLGRDMLLKRQREVKEELKHKTSKKRLKIEQNQREDFRRHMSGKFAERQTASDLYKSQKACEQLDKSKDLQCIEKWFWPETKTEKDDDENEEDNDDDDDDDDDDKDEKDDAEEEEEPEPSEKLIHLTMYLRRTHQYCIWCGTKFDDDQDMADNCPGDTAQDHE